MNGMKTNTLPKAKKTLALSLIYFELIFAVIIVLYPVVWIIGTALDPINNLGRTALIPLNATFANFTRLFQKYDYVTWYRNTGYVAVMTMVFSVLINILTTFTFGRFRFRGKKAGMLAATILQMFPSFIFLTALYMIAATFGLLNNLNMLVIIYVAGSIPANIWIVKGYLKNLPKSLDEAAYIDGASKLQVFFKILLPLSTPIISFVAFISFMGPWMDFILPSILISSREKRTLAYGLFEMSLTSGNQNDFTAFCAGALLVAAPITILYMIFQRYLITGIASGANKGE